MDAVKIPVRQRILLYDPAKVKSWRSLAAHLLRLRLNRWMGRLPKGGVLTETGGLAAGCCGHYSFWKCTILRHSHPGDRPVPPDMIAALKGEGPVPDWFLQCRDPAGEG